MQIAPFVKNKQFHKRQVTSTVVMLSDVFVTIISDKLYGFNIFPQKTPLNSQQGLGKYLISIELQHKIH